jgi:hypothetical protein
MYKTIVNPETGRKVSIHGKTGQNILRNYSQNGGDPIEKLSSQIANLFKYPFIYAAHDSSNMMLNYARTPVLISGILTRILRDLQNKDTWINILSAIREILCAKKAISEKPTERLLPLNNVDDLDVLVTLIIHKIRAICDKYACPDNTTSAIIANFRRAVDNGSAKLITGSERLGPIIHQLTATGGLVCPMLYDEGDGHLSLGAGAVPPRDMALLKSAEDEPDTTTAEEDLGTAGLFAEEDEAEGGGKKKLRRKRIQKASGRKKSPKSSKKRSQKAGGRKKSPKSSQKAGGRKKSQKANRRSKNKNAKRRRSSKKK